MDSCISFIEKSSFQLFYRVVNIEQPPYTEFLSEGNNCTTLSVVELGTKEQHIYRVDYTTESVTNDMVCMFVVAADLKQVSEALLNELIDISRVKSIKEIRDDKGDHYSNVVVIS